MCASPSSAGSVRFRRRRPWLLLAGPLVLFGLTEIVLRVIGFEYRPPDPPIILTNQQRDAAIEEGIDLFERSSATLWQLRPGASIPTLPEGAAEEFIDAAGFRGPFPATGDPLVACFGDSSTYGVWVRQGETLPAQLEAQLQKDLPGARVLNAGCVGYTVVQGRETYLRRLRDRGLDLAVLTFGCINESLPAKFFDDEDKLQHVRRQEGSWVGLTRPLLQLRLAQLLRYLLPPDEPKSLSEWLTRTGFRVLDDETRQRGDYPRRVPREKFTAALREFVARLREDGVAVVLVAPSRLPRLEESQPFLAEYSEAVAAVAQEEGIPLLDLHALLRGDPAGVEALHLPNDAVHPNARGHAIWAAALAPLVREALGS